MFGIKCPKCGNVRKLKNRIAKNKTGRWYMCYTNYWKNGKLKNYGCGAGIYVFKGKVKDSAKFNPAYQKLY